MTGPTAVRTTISLLAAVLSIVTVRTAQADARSRARHRAPEAAAVRHRPPESPGLAPQARRLTIVRAGYGGARPGSATIDIPFALEGGSWAEVEERRAALERRLRESVRADSGAVISLGVSQSQSGQKDRDGIRLTTDMGTMSITVRDLSRLRSIAAGLRTATPEPLTLRFRVGEDAGYEEASAAERDRLRPANG
jgi:hypothetical protein